MPCPVLLIAGPTASGKSTLAVRLAKATGGEIVNADSMQVYRDLKVLTARPTAQQEAAAPHHLFGHIDGALPWSVGHWLRAVADVLEGIAARGRPALVVGGSGLYFLALTRGLAEAPQVPPAAREAAAARLADIGETAFRARLAMVDPAAEARITRGDAQRLVRAMAVFETGGKALSELHATTTPIIADRAWRGVVISPPRETLYARCDARLEQMVAEGAADEVAALMARNLEPGLPVMKALGVATFAAQQRGQITPRTALAQAQAETRRYAKRQTTWLRHQAPEWPRIGAADAEEQWEAFSRWAFHAQDGALTRPGLDGMS
jgi:tRNA dimethylallyltransferase